MTPDEKRFTELVAAYKRGAEWMRENGDCSVMYLAKAACDYADKITSDYVPSKGLNMAITRFPPEVIERIVSEAFEHGRPQTQDACCAIAARVSMLADDGPWTDEHILEVSADMARGVFGPTFEAADYGQRSAWVDMCERELRKAIV